MKKYVVVLLLATLSACGGGTTDKPTALKSVSPTPVATQDPTTAATTAAPRVTVSPTPRPTKARVTASPTPRPVATSARPKPKPSATKTTVAAKSYSNCDAMHNDYPHGVGKPGAVDHTSGTPVTNFYVSTALYNANTARDRDHDGIACEA